MFFSLFLIFAEGFIFNLLSPSKKCSVLLLKTSICSDRLTGANNSNEGELELPSNHFNKVNLFILNLFLILSFKYADCKQKSHRIVIVFPTVVFFFGCSVKDDELSAQRSVL